MIMKLNYGFEVERRRLENAFFLYYTANIFLQKDLFYSIE